MASVTLVPSGYSTANSSYSSISSSYPITNAYTNTSSTTYAYITCNTGSKATTYVSLTFDVSEIPSDATIDSVSCKAKVRVSSTNYVSTAVLQLYNGTTAMGATTTARSTTATSYTISNVGTWTRATLDNLLMRFTGTRGTNQTTRAAYLYIYGAELTIEYTENTVKHTITVNTTGNGTVSPTSGLIPDGGSFELSIYPGENVANVLVTNNGINVSNQLVERTSTGGSSGNVTAVPASVTTSGSISGTYYNNAVGLGSDTTSTTTNNCYCSTNGSTADINYAFTISGIPSNATIISVTCAVKGHLESTSASTEVAKCQLYSGTTAKGTATSFTSTSNSIINVDGGSSWTLSELDNLILKFTIGYYGGLVLGATVTVNYEVAGQAGTYYVYVINSVTEDSTISVVFSEGGAILKIKLNGTWITVNKVYKKINGTWVELTNLTDLFDTNLKYIKAN